MCLKKIEYYRIILLLGLFTLGFTSCKKSHNLKEHNNKEQSVFFEDQTIFLKIGEGSFIQAVFQKGVVPTRDYQWSSSDNTIVTVEAKEGYKALLRAVNKGKAVIRVYSKDGSLSATCTVQVGDGIIRILAIGNSFSDDAIEYYLHSLATADKIPVIIGNLYIGGASLSKHVATINENKSEHSYRKIDISGNKVIKENTSIATALADEQWDYVSFQQVSQNSGQYETYVTPLPELYNYVKGKLNNPATKYILHQTWAYAKNASHTGFINYGRDQLIMYNDIIDAVNKAKQLVGIDVVVPAGTAIQNGRTSAIGDNFCRDGYHLDINIGRYTASATWFEAIFGRSVVGNLFRPAALTDFEVQIAQNAAHFAMIKPNQVTEMVDFREWPSTDQSIADIFVDFNRASSIIGWNGFTGELDQYRLNNLRDKNGNYTGVGMEVTKRFNGQNLVGATSTKTDFNMPNEVSSSSYFGNAKAEFGGIIVKESILKLTGLNKNNYYNLCFFASRMEVTDNRETDFTIKGQSQITVSLNASNNTSKIICSGNVKPTEDGELYIEITAGKNNNNSVGFYYLNAMRITMSKI